MSAQLTWRVLDETSGAGMAANRPAFSLKLPRWSYNLRQRAYNCRESPFKMEIPVRVLESLHEPIADLRDVGAQVFVVGAKGLVAVLLHSLISDRSTWSLAQP